MSTVINQIEDKKTWEELLIPFGDANFLSSWNWGQFHQSLGKKVFYLHIDSKSSGVCLVIKEVAKRGNYLTIAGGPLIDWSSPEDFRSLVSYLKTLAKKENCHFVRIRPQILDTSENQTLFQKNGLTPSPMHLTADLTWQLDLNQTEDQILAGMRKNTRYDVKRVEKLGISVTTSNNPLEIKEFYDHQLALAKKHGFVPFSYEFLHNQFKIFAADNQVLLFHAFHEGKLLASAFIIFYGSEAVYHYGISTPENNKLPGSHAVLWAAILEAKKRGLSRFNFWGIAPEGSVGHRFWGVTIFKKGFGGKEVAYLPAHDLPTSTLYPLVKAFETIRAKRRHLA